MKPGKLFLSALLTASVFVACNNDADDPVNDFDSTNNNTAANGATQQSAQAIINPVFADTSINGTARFQQMEDGRIKMTLNLSVPAKAGQSVAVHIHEHGNCGDTAKHAGGHWNPTNVAHGKWGSAAFHSGDIGNVTLDAQGTGSMELDTDLWSIGGDAGKNILNKTLVVHGGVDDYSSQPSGNSGTRIGCGVIIAGGQ